MRFTGERQVWAHPPPEQSEATESTAITGQQVRSYNSTSHRSAPVTSSDSKTESETLFESETVHFSGIPNTTLKS